MSLFLGLVGDQSPITASRFLGEPAQMVHGHRHLRLALGQWFTVFQGNHPRNFFPTPMQFGGNLIEHFASTFARNLPPAGEGSVGLFERLGYHRPGHG